MAYVACDKDGTEWVYEDKPTRESNSDCHFCNNNIWSAFEQIELPKGSIRKLIGKDLTWEDEPVELKEQ